MKEAIKKNVLAIIGAAIVGIGVGWILLPLKLSTGGFSGIATLVHYLFNLNAGLVTLILNIPLFIFALKMLGFKYSIRTCGAMISLSVAMWLTEIFLPPLTNDMFLASIFGGAIVGLGIALTIKGDATTGGTDLVAKLIQTKNSHLNLGEILLVIDGLIIAVSAFTFESIEVALYSGIAVFVMTKIIDFILEGANYAKAIYIISNKSDEIAEYIIKNLDRGATKLTGTGMYSKKERDILYCIANKREIPKIKEKVKEVDEKAFMIVTTVTEAIGEGFEK